MLIMRVRSFQVVAASVAAAFLAIAVSSLVSFGQTPEPADEPGLGPAPTIVISDVAQSIVTRVIFNSPTDVEFISGVVSHAPAPGRFGAPPSIKVEVFDVGGALIETFNAWHPLWIESENEDGGLSFDIAPSGEGRYVFDFAPDIGIVKITDIELDLGLIEIDARQVVLDYCAGSPDDPGCASVPGAGQLPDTGSAPLDGSSSSLLWVTAIAGALALAGGGSVAWLTYQRRRSR